MWEQTWLANIPNHIRCSNYTAFKKEHTLELYLYKLSSNLRINLTKFRCRCNKLPISQVFNEQQICNTQCTLCELNVVGDEFHYLFECSFFSGERIKYLTQYYRHFPSMYKFEQLFNSTNLKVISNLAKFVTIIMNKFRNPT